MIKLSFLSDDEILEFLQNDWFIKPIRELIYEVGAYNIVKSMRDEEDLVYALYRKRLLLGFKDGDDLLAIANVFPVNNATVEQYSFYRNDISPFLFAKYGKLYFDLVKTLPVIRIQATVLENNKDACRWHEKLGFKCEGLMRKYDGKYNYWLYAYIKDKP